MSEITPLGLAAAEQIVLAGHITDELDANGLSISIMDFLDVLGILGYGVVRNMENNPASFGYMMLNSKPGTLAHDQLTQLLGDDPQMVLDIAQVNE